MRCLSALFLLSACSPVTRIGDKIIGLTNPVLVGGLVIGTKPPADPALRAALEANGVMDFTEVRLVVADALALQDIEQALVTDAALTVRAPDPFVMTAGDDGWYGLSRAAAPPYSPGASWTLEADLPDRVLPGTVQVELPEAAVVALDAEHEPGADLVFDLTGQGFDYAYATVFDWRGEEVYSSAPVGNDEIVDLVLPSSDQVERVVIPGDVFQDEDLYIVGMAGMRRAPAETVEGLNEALTAVFAGRLELFPMVAGSRIASTALFFSMEAPEPALGALLDDAGVGTGGFVEVFVADLLALGAGVPGASLTLDGDPVADLGDGRYRLDGFDGIAGDQPFLRVDTDVAQAGVLQPTVPLAVAPDVPSTAVFGQGLSVSLPGGPYQAGFGLVVGADGLTWSNLPETPDAWRFVLEREGDVSALRLPASAFPSPGVYAVGIAPVLSVPGAVIDLNPTFSAALVGSMSFHTVLVTP
jgi:hypothetical protein